MCATASMNLNSWSVKLCRSFLHETDVKLKVQKKLASGTRPKTSPYTRLDTAQLNGETIRLDDINEDWIVVGITDMPDDMREIVMDIVESTVPGLIQVVDTRQEGIGNVFQALHVSVYNRYAQHVCDIPFVL